MSISRLGILPDEEMAIYLPRLREFLSATGRKITPEKFRLVAANYLPYLLSVFRVHHGSEGTVWIADRNDPALVPVFNSGPHADEFVGKYRQPLTSGLISMVFSTEKSFISLSVSERADHDKSLDTRLHLNTSAMLAVPFYFLNECRGVISCVQLQGETNAPLTPFALEDLSLLGETADMIGKLIDFALLQYFLGLSEK
jgi:hypothetical protein